MNPQEEIFRLENLFNRIELFKNKIDKLDTLVDLLKLEIVKETNSHEYTRYLKMTLSDIKEAIDILNNKVGKDKLNDFIDDFKRDIQIEISYFEAILNSASGQ